MRNGSNNAEIRIMVNRVTQSLLYHSVHLFQDFGDGGAYPEIHVAQYPLNMGKKKTTSNALAVAVDSSGNLKYDAIARHGHAQDKVRPESALLFNVCLEQLYFPFR